MAERCFLQGRETKALSALAQNRGDSLQQLLETVTDYGNIGAADEALALLAQAAASGASFASPLVKYYQGYYTLLLGKADAARSLFGEAAAMPTDYCFPFRHEELRMLSSATELCPSDANSWYYLGNLYYYYEQRERGIAAWEKAVALKPAHELALRNLGFAYGRIPDKRELAISHYEAAVKADPQNVAPVLEMDKLAEKVGRDSATRLAFLESHMATVQKSDPTVLRLAYLYNETGQFDQSLAILTTRRFHVWEGAEALRQPFVDACLLRGLARLSAGRPSEALQDFLLAETYPENLQAGRPGDAGQAPKIHYYAARAFQALGQAEQAKAQLRKALEGRVTDGEMSYYRLLACRELGDAAGAAEQAQKLKRAVAALEMPDAVDAYAKFGGENTPAERVGHRTTQSLYLRGLAALAEGKPGDAKELLGQALKERPSMIWARALAQGLL